MRCENEMNVKISFMIFLISILFTFLSAKPLVQDTLLIDSTALILNWTGYRTAIGMRIYKAGLYLVHKSDKAQEIINADLPMAVFMEITSSLVTEERLEQSTRAGFKNASGENLSVVKNEIDSFITLVKTNVRAGDHYLFVYVPDNGTKIIKNGNVIGIIYGLPFKKALFGIWLCSKPPQQELKKGMLGM